LRQFRLTQELIVVFKNNQRTPIL